MAKILYFPTTDETERRHIRRKTGPNEKAEKPREYMAMIVEWVNEEGISLDQFLKENPDTILKLNGKEFYPEHLKHLEDK